MENMKVVYYQKLVFGFEKLYDWQIFFRAKKPIRIPERKYIHTFE